MPRPSSWSFPIIIDDDEIGRHGVIAEHTAHRTNDADGGWTNTVPHPVPPSGEPVHVIRGMCARVLFYLLFCARFVMAYKSRVWSFLFSKFILWTPFIERASSSSSYSESKKEDGPKTTAWSSFGRLGGKG